MRRVAILHLSPDSPVDNFLAGIRANQSSWTEVAAESFGTDAGSFGRAITRIANLNGEFDTLLLVTHGRSDDVATGEVEFRVRTATVGGVIRSNWYLVAEELDPIVNEEVALVSTVCFSNQHEFREAMERRLPGYALAGVGNLQVAMAVAGTLGFFRISHPFTIGDLGQIHEAIREDVQAAAAGQMDAWIPGDTAQS